mmetsp:Transcript_5126/g.10192  ORF Transcript_5126/g.10192 Transcript_5126/m.10192 type:complete len:244 (+) Transcript_5126:172-903(+)
MTVSRRVRVVCTDSTYTATPTWIPQLLRFSLRKRCIDYLSHGFKRSCKPEAALRVPARVQSYKLPPCLCKQRSPRVTPIGPATVPNLERSKTLSPPPPFCLQSPNRHVPHGGDHPQLPLPAGGGLEVDVAGIPHTHETGLVLGSGGGNSGSRGKKKSGLGKEGGDGGGLCQLCLNLECCDVGIVISKDTHSEVDGPVRGEDYQLPSSLSFGHHSFPWLWLLLFLFHTFFILWFSFTFRVRRRF